MVKFLGLIDILASVILLFLAAGAVIPSLMVVVSIGLVLKASIAIMDVGSITDIIAVALILSSLFTLMPWWILATSSVFMAIKGMSSLAA